MPFGGIVWREDTLTPSLNAFPVIVEEALFRNFQGIAESIEDWMRDNAPWEDQTGAAREGLTARPYRTRGNIGIVIFHTVDYGIWLEVTWGGTYAIIQPTIEEWGPRVMEDAVGGLFSSDAIRLARGDFLT